MATNVLTATGIDSEWFFPGVRGGTFTVLQTDPTVFRIQYAMDGNPGEGLIVEFSGSGFTYSGNDPTGGTVQSIQLFAADGTTELANIDENNVSLADFDSATLPGSLHGSGFDSFVGNDGDDTFRYYGSDSGSWFVGGAGNDSFVIGGTNTSFQDGRYYGSAQDGSGGAGEINEIVLATQGTGFAQLYEQTAS